VVGPPLDPALRAFDAVYNFTSSFSEIHFYIALLFPPRSPRGSPSFHVSNQNSILQLAEGFLKPSYWYPWGYQSSLLTITSSHSYFSALPLNLLHKGVIFILNRFRISLYIIKMPIINLYHKGVQNKLCIFYVFFHGVQTSNTFETLNYFC
jgi:hypothetical protein